MYLLLLGAIYYLLCMHLFREGNKLWQRLEVGLDEAVDDTVPGGKWVKPSQKNHYLLSNGAASRGGQKGMELQLLPLLALTSDEVTEWRTAEYQDLAQEPKKMVHKHFLCSKVLALNPRGKDGSEQTKYKYLVREATNVSKLTH